MAVDKGIVCLTDNADVRFDFDQPYQCHKLGASTYGSNWCYEQNQDESLPNCSVAGCCALHLGGNTDDYNPLAGKEYVFLSGEIELVGTDQYYVCCNGGTEEIFGCLDPTAINYDENAT